MQSLQSRERIADEVKIVGAFQSLHCFFVVHVILFILNANERNVSNEVAAAPAEEGKKNIEFPFRNTLYEGKFGKCIQIMLCQVYEIFIIINLIQYTEIRNEMIIRFEANNRLSQTPCNSFTLVTLIQITSRFNLH